MQPFDKLRERQYVHINTPQLQPGRRELIHLALKYSAFPRYMFMLSSNHEPIRDADPTPQVAARRCGLVRQFLVDDRSPCDVRTPRLQ